MPIYDVKLDPLTGDLPLFTEFITGNEVIRQRLENRFATHLEGWFLDQTVGIPYIDWIGTKPVPIGEISAKFRTEIESTPGVVRVDDFEVNFEPAPQRTTITGIARLSDDPDDALIITITDTDPETGNAIPWAAFFELGTIAP